MIDASTDRWTQIDFPGALEVPFAGRATSSPAVENHPNPFTPSTSIAVRVDEPVTDARIVIFDAQGREVRTIPIGDVQSIEMRVAWDGRDDAGVQLPAGVYLYRLVHDGGASEAAKAVILR
jgi:flagellar hook assembly protein FlgD